MDSIALSTAAFCLWGITPDEKLSICRRLGFRRIEVALSTERMVREFLQFLDRRPHDLGDFHAITVHAPWHGITYGDRSRSRRLTAQLADIAARLPVEAITVHADCVRNLESLLESGLPICLENSVRDMNWETLETFAAQTSLPLALNLNRAVRAGERADELLSRWGHRVERIHVSGYSGAFSRTPVVSSQQLHFLERVRHLQVPLVLEGLFDPGDIPSIERERQMVWKCYSGCELGLVV